jgi:hypothetical protein
MNRVERGPWQKLHRNRALNGKRRSVSQGNGIEIKS